MFEGGGWIETGRFGRLTLGGFVVQLTGFNGALPMLVEKSFSGCRFGWVFIVGPVGKV